jgi:hypothetical protein
VATDEIFPQQRLSEVENLLQATTEELLTRLGRTHRTRGLTRDPGENGQRLYQSVIVHCRETIGLSGTIQRASHNRHAVDATHLVCAIADAVLHHVGSMIPATTIGAIVAHNGIESICKNYWGDK